MHLILALCLIPTLLASGVGEGSHVRPMTMRELCDGSTAVVMGRVTALSSAWDANQQKIQTTVTIQVMETWKGLPALQHKIVVDGGTVGHITMKCSEAPVFHQDDQAICFLRPRPQSTDMEVYGWFRGQFTVVEDSVREMRGMSLVSFKEMVQETILKGR